MLVAVFAAVAVLTTQQRSELEGQVQASFLDEVRDSTAGTGPAPDCMKIETYHFECVTGGTAPRAYDLTFEDDGCWLAKAKGDAGAPAPRRLVGCVPGTR